MLLCLALLGLSALVPAFSAAVGRPLLIGFSQDTPVNDWHVTQVDTLKRAFARHPDVHFVVTDGRGDGTRQIRDIEDLLQRHSPFDVIYAQSASPTYPARGGQAAYIAIAVAHGISVPKRLSVDSILPTRENARQVKPVF